MKVLMFILGVFLIPSASAALSTVPLRQVWSLATDDVVSVNASTRIATATAYVPNASGTIYRIKATTNGVRLLTIAEEAAVGGKGNPWLTAALAAGSLTYVGYQWYKESYQKKQEETGSCSYLPLGSSGRDVTLSQCLDLVIKDIESKTYIDSRGVAHHNTDVMASTSLISQSGELHRYKVWVTYSKARYASGDPGFAYIPMDTTFLFEGNKITEVSEVTKNPVSDSEVESELLSSLANQSSRQAFGENNQPYPLEGLFTNEDLVVDPTYSPSADLNTETLPDYITKYNNGLLQTTDPSAPNYVTPSQYQYIKSQAEQAAATAAGGSTSTNPLEGMEQPITQKQYDDSNLKTATAEKTAINAVAKPELSGLLKPLDDYKTDIESINLNTVSTINKPSSLGYGSSTCWRPTLKSFNGTTVSPGDAYCSDYDSFSNPLAVWALWIGTALYLWHFGREQLTERV